MRGYELKIKRTGGGVQFVQGKNYFGCFYVKEKDGTKSGWGLYDELTGLAISNTEKTLKDLKLKFHTELWEKMLSHRKTKFYIEQLQTFKDYLEKMAKEITGTPFHHDKVLKLIDRVESEIQFRNEKRKNNENA